MKIIYCDGIFDLFHVGHLRHLEQIRALFDEPIELIVGVVSDMIAAGYKRVPIMNEQHRLSILQACIYVDRAFITDVLVMDEAFLHTHNIDYVVHAFTEADKEKQREFFRIPIELGKFIEMDYNIGISTSQIINEYSLMQSDIQESPLDHCRTKCEIAPTDRVLVVGQYIGDIGTKQCICLDTNQSRAAQDMVHAQYPIICFAHDIRIFKPAYFDYIVLSNQEYEADNLHDELKRVFNGRIIIAT